MKNQIVEAIHKRRSVRSFTDEAVTEEDMRTILEAGRWAPSGINNQPWRFVIVQSPEKKNELAEFTKYGGIIRNANVCIAVFAELSVCYHEIKDAQSIGACMENMLLAAHSLGLGAVWLGEILNRADDVRQCLELDDGKALHAVMALGRPAKTDQKSSRKSLDELIVKRF